MTVTALFERRAAAAPDAVALVSGDDRIGYGELNDAADRIARYLREHGLVGGAVVAVTLPRGFTLVAALLAVLKAGAGYTLIDAGLPAVRQRAILADSGASLLLDADLIARALSDPSPAANPGVQVRPDSVACVIFTSGPAGRPLGVAAPHRALTATYTGQDYARFDERQVWLQCSPVSWESFGLELFGALLYGGTCVLYPGRRPDPRTLADLIVRHGVTQLHVTADLFNALADSFPESFEGLELVFAGGEFASARRVARLLGRYPKLRVANGYGPLESLGFTTAHRVRPDDLGAARLPVGVPVAHKGIRLLDDKLQPTPSGQTGQLWATGAGLAHGYIRQPGLTADRFMPDPQGGPGSRMFRTGDRGYRDPDGTLHVTGRADGRVKIRGFRVEPGDIAHALRQLPGVKEAGVVARAADGADGEPEAESDLEPELSAYVTTAAATPPDPGRLRTQLVGLLPEYMIPAAITIVPELPAAAREPAADAFTRFAVVINDEEQYSVWPTELELPAGWRGVGRVGTRQECLDHIEELWTDIRPLSLRTALGVRSGS